MALGGVTINWTSTQRVELASCKVQNKRSFLLGCLAQQEYWSDLRADTGALFLPDKIQTNTAKHSQLHKEENLFSVKGMLMAPLVTAGVSDDVAQELQMPMGQQTLEDAEEPMPSRRATLEDPGHSWSNRAGSAQSDASPEPGSVQSPRRTTRTRLPTPRADENRRKGATTSV